MPNVGNEAIRPTNKVKANESGQMRKASFSLIGVCASRRVEMFSPARGNSSSSSRFADRSVGPQWTQIHEWLRR